MTSEAGKPLLQMAEYHLSHTKAREHVIRLLKANGAKRPSGDWAHGSYTLRTSDGMKQLNFREMVDEARRTGRVEVIQNMLDSAHPIFGGTLGMAISSPNMKISFEFAGYQESLKGPARTYPVEQELVGDILECRRLACASSAPGSFVGTVRFYRFYLFSCVALLDAFVNRFIHLGKYEQMTGSSFEQLCTSRRIEERMELWADVFGANQVDVLKKGAPWDHFKKLRAERNRQIHAGDPFLGYRIDKIGTKLNYCRQGVGGLLLRMLKLANSTPHSLFDRLRLAPEVRYVRRK